MTLNNSMVLAVFPIITDLRLNLNVAHNEAFYFLSSVQAPLATGETLRLSAAMLNLEGARGLTTSPNYWHLNSSAQRQITSVMHALHAQTLSHTWQVSTPIDKPSNTLMALAVMSQPHAHLKCLITTDTLMDNFFAWTEDVVAAGSCLCPDNAPE